jgi:hypothetical protein
LSRKSAISVGTIARFSVSENGVLLYQGGSAGNHQLAWFNRQGQLLAEVGPRNDYLSLRLSPDERHVVVNRLDDPDTVFPTIWVMDLLREGVVFVLPTLVVRRPNLLSPGLQTAAKSCSAEVTIGVCACYARR